MSYPHSDVRDPKHKPLKAKKAVSIQSFIRSKLREGDAYRKTNDYEPPETLRKEFIKKAALNFINELGG